MGLGEELVEGWIPQFWSADHAIKWLEVEREHSMWLTDSILLVGAVDAIGLNEVGQHFFGEWKSQAPPPAYKKFEWKATWRMNPQSLTYGVLVDSLYPGTRNFTVRKAYKSRPPSYDFEWFSFTTAEIDWWRDVLIGIGHDIAAARTIDHAPWLTNFNACFKYGLKYACPFFETGCSRLDWSNVPFGATDRIPHLEVEREALTKLGPDSGVTILDATRVGIYLECHERYRKTYVEGLNGPVGEALIDGKEMHSLLAAYYRKLREDALVKL